jgi:hypothetical protein
MQMIKPVPHSLGWLLSACAVCSILTANGADGAKPVLETQASKELLDAIAREFPRSTIVQPSDIDPVNCGQLKAHPGLGEGDFNGDGRNDYAVLLKGRVKGEKEWQGRVLQLMEVDFVIFLREASGQLRSIRIEHLENYHPFTVGIAIMKPGLVRESPVVGNSTVRLLHPGILMYLCGRSAAVFYWDRNTNSFDSITTID